MRIKVLHIIIKSSYDGAAVYPIRLCTHMKEYDHEIVACFKGNAYEEILNLGIKCENLLNFKNIGYKYLLLKYWNFFRYIKKRSFNIIHYHQGGVGILLLASLFKKNAKVIHHLHSGNMIGDNKKYIISPFHKFILSILRRNTFQVAVAKHVAEKYFVQIGNSDKLIIIENTVPFNFNLKPDLKFGIGYLGRITSTKGFYLFNALAENKTSQKGELKFFLMGDIDPNISINISAEKVFEFIPPSFLISNILSKIDLLVLPSNAPEGLPLALLEAVSFDVGIIAPSTEAFKEALGTYPLLTGENSTEEIINKINHYYSEKFDRKELSLMHKEIYSKYNFDQMLKKLDNFYKTVLADTTSKMMTKS